MPVLHLQHRFPQALEYEGSETFNDIDDVGHTQRHIIPVVLRILDPILNRLAGTITKNCFI